MSCWVNDKGEFIQYCTRCNGEVLLEDVVYVKDKNGVGNADEPFCSEFCMVKYTSANYGEPV